MSYLWLLMGKINSFLVVMSYDDIEVGQHGFRWWLGAVKQQNITWTYFGLLSVKYSSEGYITGNIKLLMIRICWKITHLKLLPYLWGYIQFKIDMP